MERLVSSSFRPRLLLPPRSTSSSSFPRFFGGLNDEFGRVLLPGRRNFESLGSGSTGSSKFVVRCSVDDSLGRDFAEKDRISVDRNGFQALRNKALITLVAATVMFLGQPAHGTVQLKTGGVALAKAEVLSSAWAGFLTGCLHTLSGPDHLAALAPLSIGRTRLESAAVGALWGCGHDAGQVLFGLLFLTLKDRLHIEVLRVWGTRVVGLTLVAIGAMGIREAAEMPVPALEPGMGLDLYPGMDNPKPKKKIGFATFATGIVHGLQPDALMMVLPALALPSRLAGAAFLIMFLIGTVVSMGSYTVFLGSCSEALKDRIPRVTEKLTWASSILAITMGLTLIVSQYFGFSLY